MREKSKLKSENVPYIPKPLKDWELRDPATIKAVLELAYRISRRMGVKPSDWYEFLLFLVFYADQLGIDGLVLEDIAALEHFEAHDDWDERKTKRFYERRDEWFNDRLCHRPLAGGAYLHPNTRDWFVSVATILKAIFPAVVKRSPNWRSHRHFRNWRKIRRAWRPYRDKLREQRRKMSRR